MISDANNLLTHQNNETIKFTPRELIKYHIEHPEIPITDKDIENLELGIPIASKLYDEYLALKNDNNINLTNNKNTTTIMLF